MGSSFSLNLLEITYRNTSFHLLNLSSQVLLARIFGEATGAGRAVPTGTMNVRY